MRHLYLKVIYLICCVVIISGCSTNITTTSTTPKDIKTSKHLPTTPSWFTHSQTNADNLLYGFGSGKTSQQATKNALGDMVQRLQVTVSATTSFENITGNNNISQKLIQQVTTQTADINIPNYTVINQLKSGKTYYIELQVNKKQAIKDLEKLITSNIDQAQQLLITTGNKSSLYRFNITQKVNNNLKTIKSSLRTLVILKPDSNISKQMEGLNNINNNLLNLKRGLQIYIKKQDSGFFYDSIKKFMKVNNYNLVNYRDYPNITFSLKLKDYNNEIKNNKYCLNTQVELQATDDLSRQLSPKIYKIKSCSDKGRSAAIDNAVEIFYSQLNNAESIY